RSPLRCRLRPGSGPPWRIWWRAQSGAVACLDSMRETPAMIRRDYHRASFEEQRIAKWRRRSQTKGMTRSLDHLPAGKRAELAFVAELLRSSFDEAVSTRRAEHLKSGRILRIVLYGSYARGD